MPLVSVSSGSSAEIPASAASIPRPVSFRPPPFVQRTASGRRHRWAMPAACAPAMAEATSETILTPVGASSRPETSRSVRVSPTGHSSTM